MLNLLVTVSNLIHFLISVIFLFPALTAGLYITYPEAGGTVSGIVEVRGSVPDAGFESAQLEYSYTNATTSTWFLIARLDRVIQDDVMAKWDTTTISDGIYTLRLKVNYRNGKSDGIKLENINVANYTRPGQTPVGAIPSEAISTPVPVNPQITEIHPTPLPANPASINGDQFMNSLFVGSLAAAGILAIVGIYSALRRYRRRR